jgi:hypothetical protein
MPAYIAAIDAPSPTVRSRELGDSVNTDAPIGVHGFVAEPTHGPGLLHEVDLLTEHPPSSLTGSEMPIARHDTSVAAESASAAIHKPRE